MSYGLDFLSGKLWVAEQLDSISKRYLNPNSHRLAQEVRASALNDGQRLKYVIAMKSGLPVIGGQGKLVLPRVQSWLSNDCDTIDGSSKQ
jgi:hypothetical protein